MDNAGLRVSFHAFAGDERYCKFVRTVNNDCRRKNRLLAWQDVLWREFAAANSISMPVSDVLRAFAVCEVHSCEVAVGRSVDEAGVRLALEYEIAKDRSFPHSTGDVICDECLKARATWVADHADITSIMRCTTTYEGFYARRYPEVIADPVFHKRIQERAAEIAARMQPGDELWEWDAGGWHSFSGAAGVAIVRDGAIIERWCEMRS